jgi:tetratricopeptide (TPR) repeat protein
MRIRILAAFLILISSFSFAQQQRKTDSLKTVIRTAKTDTAKVQALNNLSLFYWDTNADTSLKLLNESLGFANQMAGPKRAYWLAVVNENLGNYYIYVGDAVKALGHFSVSITCWDTVLAHADSSRVASYTQSKSVAMGNMGLAYELQGNYPKALEYYFEALAICEKNQNKRAMASRYTTIAIVFDAQKDSVRALEYYMKALELFTAIGDSSNLGKVCSNIGVLYFNSGNFAAALRYDSLALDIHTRRGNNRSVAVVLSNIGLVYQSKGDYITALDCFQRALALDIMVGNTRGQMIRMTNIGTAYTELKRYREAEQYLSRAMVMADSMQNAAVQQEVHLSLSNLYKATGRFDLALREYTLYAGMKDSLFNIERDRDLARKEASYEFDKKTDSTRAAQEKKDIADLAAKQLADETLKRTRLILFAFAGGFLLLGVLAFFIFRSYREKQKANVEISRQKAIIEQKNKDVVDSIVYAQRIQNALFASEELLSRHLTEYFVLFKPKDIVSGDFYYATVKGQSFYLAVCDSTGHGVPGAFMSLLNIAYLNEAVNEQKLTSTEKILNHVRARLIENISAGGQQDGMDGILVRFNLWAAQHEIEFSAAYNAPFVVRNGVGESLHADKMPVGKSDKTDSFTLCKTELPKGSCLYLFTDGLADQFGGNKGKKMKRKVLEEKLLSVSGQPMPAQKAELEKFFAEWKSAHEQVDDVLLIGIRM